MASGRVVTFCVALLATVSAVSAVKKLNSINDLKKIQFGKTVPKHSLVLLHWFANTINVDNNDNIWLTFEPNSRDYGSHHYGNYEGILDPLPHGTRYYTVGNLGQATSLPLPSYVLHSSMAQDGRNRDRIIFRVRDGNTRWQALQRIDAVYITQHYGGSNSGTSYDPDHTYQITTNLLIQLREFSLELNHNSLSELRDDFGRNTDDSQLESLKIKWGDLACLALLLYIVIEEKHLPNRRNNLPRAAPKRQAQPHIIVDIPDDTQNRWDLGKLTNPEQIRLEVTTGKNGKARIEWHGVPDYRLYDGVKVQLFENNWGQDASFTKTIRTRSGFCDTSVPLNSGLQARLHKTRTQCCFWTVVAEEICRGDEFQNPGRVKIQDYDASLQLFVKDGKACARLFVNRSFHNWRQAFCKSWVGFYTDANKATREYGWWKWQWATKFEQSTFHDNSHSVYEYQSSMNIAPGVQARFIFKDDVVKAHTASWK